MGLRLEGAMNRADGRESVVDRAELLKIAMDEVDPSLGLVRADAHHVGDFHKLRRVILTTRHHFDFGIVVVEPEELPCSLQVLQEAGGK